MSESLSCASEQNHFKRLTLSSTSLPVPESVHESSAVPLTVCLQGTGMRTQALRCYPPQHLPVASSQEL